MSSIHQKESRRILITTDHLGLVTHDRRMLQNVRLDRSWLVDGGRVVEL
jgi:hypothetical protein